MKKSYKNKRVVCLGGGNAMPKAVLAGLKKYPVKISAICAMLDSGGLSTKRLRRDYKILAPGDIRRAFVALSDASDEIIKLFSYRFSEGELKNYNFADIFITALQLSSHNYEKTFEVMVRVLNVSHEVLPVVLSNSNLCAVLENGEKIVGEENIDVPQHNKRLKIKKAFLEPRIRAYPKALKAIEKADLIVIGPGDLYSSIIQVLLAKGISGAIKKSRAKKIYVCNLMTKSGETNDFSVKDFADEVEEYLSSKLDYVIFNSKKPDAKQLAYSRKHYPEFLKMVEFDKNLNKNKFIAGNVLVKENKIMHDPSKLAKIILSLI